MQHINRLLAFIVISAFAIVARAQYDDEIRIPIPQWHMTQMTQDRQGMMWFATWNGLCRYDGYDFVTFKNQPGDGIDIRSDRVRGVMLGRDGNLYCRVEDEILRFNLATYRYEKTSCKSLKEVEIKGYGKTKDKEKYFARTTNQDVRRVFTDQQGNIWILRRYSAAKIVKPHTPMQWLDCVSKNVVRCMYHDVQNHQIWIGTKEAGIVTVVDERANLVGYLDRNGNITSRPVHIFPVYSMARTSPKTLWIGAKPDGLFRLHQKSATSYQMEKIPFADIPSENIYDIKLDKQGRMWIATHGEGIFVCPNPEAQHPVFHSLAHLIKGMKKEVGKVRRIYPMPDGKRMIAATVGGVLVIDNISGNDVGRYKAVLHRREPDRASSLSNSATMNIVLPEKEGQKMYVSTESGGVNKLLSKSITDQHLEFQHLGPAQGLCSDDVLSATRLGDDVVIVSIDEVALYDPTTDKSCIYHPQFWGARLRFSDASPLRLADGRWMFAMENGVILVPEKVWKQKSYSPKIAISSVKIENSEPQYNVNDIDTIVLASDERNLTISFAAMDFSAVQRLMYQTRFKSGDWGAPTEEHTARLYDLAPGEHTLQIRSTNAQGLWTDNVRSVLIIVKPHWYETLWAKAIYLLLLIAVISGVTHLIYYIRDIDRQRRDTLDAYLALLQKSTVQQTDNKEEVITQEIPNSIPISRQNPEDEAFMAKLLAAVDANIGNSDAGVDDLAEAVAMSRSSLTRRTKNLLGITPSDLLREARMKLACSLLREHNHHTISEVAYSCGFSDPKYFAKCFKVSVGMSPKQYSQGIDDDNQ